jgi:hypothetical protein
MTSEEVKSDLGRPPHFDSTNYPYWHVRMSCFLEAKGLGVWRVVNEGMKPLTRPTKPTKADEKEMHLNVIARNSLLESLSNDVFNRVYNLKIAYEIWNTLEELHKGTKDVREQKHHLVKEAFNSFKMMPNELANDMYSHLNVIVNELNEIGLAKLSDEDISRKIIQVHPKSRYSTIVTCFHLFEDLSKIKPTQVLSKIIAHELYL